MTTTQARQRGRVRKEQRLSETQQQVEEVYPEAPGQIEHSDVPQDSPASRAFAAVELADTLSDEAEHARVLNEGMAAARAILDDVARSRAFAHLANRMPVCDRGPALREALAAARCVVDERYRAQLVEILVPELEDLIDGLAHKTGVHEGVGESKWPVYTLGIMRDDLPDLEITLRAAAYYSGRPIADVRARLGMDDAVSESTARAKAKPRARKANPELTAARLKAAYEVLVRESDLANPALSDDERLRRSVNLRNTYDRLHKLDSSFQDTSEQLRLARKFLNSRAYRRRSPSGTTGVSI